MKISLAPPTVLSGEICAQLKPQGLSIEPTVVIERNLMFEAPVVVAPGCRLNRMQIGAYSHIAPLSALQVATLGRYCTIGSKVEIGVGMHTVHNATTSHAARNNPLFMGYSGFIPLTAEQTQDSGEDLNIVTLGHDVVVGAHCIFPQNVTVGHGAYIEAGSIITHDVPPYAIVSGKGGGANSHGIIKGYRFSDEVIADLLELQWWDYDLPQMLALGLKVPLDNIKDFIAFMRNEEREHLVKIESQWRYLQVHNAQQVTLIPVDPQRSSMGTLLTPPEIVPAVTAPTQSGAGAAQSDAVSAQSGTVPAQSGAVSVQSGTGTAQSGAVSAQSGTVPASTY